MPIIHNRVVSYPGGGFSGTTAPIFRMIGPESLKLGSWGADVLDGLEALANKPVLIRNRMSSFNAPDWTGGAGGILNAVRTSQPARTTAIPSPPSDIPANAVQRTADVSALMCS